MHWQWTFRAVGTGTEVLQTWRLLRTDPVLGATRADLDNLRDYMIVSVDTTLHCLADRVRENTPAASAPPERHRPDDRSR